MSTKSEPLPDFTIYSRPGCHLCDVMEKTLKKIRPKPYRSLRFENIDESRELQRRYSMDIPVLSINGKDAFRYKVTEIELRKWLETESDNRQEL